MPSLSLVLETFERERDRQLDHFDATDTKAGVVLGFAEVIAALANGTASALRGPALMSSVVAASFALAAFWPRQLPAVNPVALRRYIMAEDRITRLVLVDTYLSMSDEARDLVGTEAFRLKIAMVALGVAAAVAALGEIVR